MPLTLSTRRVGRVTVVRCSGRMVAGVEADSVRRHITELLVGEKHFVLHLGEVTFMDSSGMGTMVRMLATARQAGGDIKLCQVTREVAAVLKITNLTQLFQMHEQEEEAIAAFYRQNDGPEQASRTGARLLCVDQSADVLAYVREFLGHAGFDVLSSSSVPDALILLRVTHPALLVLGPTSGRLRERARPLIKSVHGYRLSNWARNSRPCTPGKPRQICCRRSRLDWVLQLASNAMFRRSSFAVGAAKPGRVGHPADTLCIGECECLKC